MQSIGRTPFLGTLVLRNAGNDSRGWNMLQNILLVTDGSAPAKRAADFAASLATRFGSTITVVHAYDRVPSYLDHPFYNEALGRVLQGAML
jgi:Universal stress protein family